MGEIKNNTNSKEMFESTPIRSVFDDINSKQSLTNPFQQHVINDKKEDSEHFGTTVKDPLLLFKKPQADHFKSTQIKSNHFIEDIEELTL
jgi:hypothetical protein